MTYPELARVRRTFGRSTARRDQAFRRRLDSDSVQVAVDLPAPSILARTYVGPYFANRHREVYQAARGSAFLTRPEGHAGEPRAAHIPDLITEIRRDLAALPEARDAGDPYNHLRTFAQSASNALFAEYATAALRAFRQDAPMWRSTPKERAPRATPIPEQERLRAYRARRDSIARREAAQWLHDMIEEGELKPGERVAAREVWTRAREVFEDWSGMCDDDGTPVYTPGRTVFYAVADEVLGPRRTVRGSKFYVVRANVTDRADPAKSHLSVL